MSYDKQILKILHEAGDTGIRINILAKNVFNESNSLFGELTYDVVYNYVRAYVRKNSQSPDALIVSMEQRGFYRINKMMITQLQLNFLDEEDKPADNNDDIRKDCEDLSLSLFKDDEC